MKIDQNPFSLYDFLGYFIPGALLLYLLFIVPKIESVDTFTGYFDAIRVGNFEAYLPFIIVSYVAGHLQSFLSSYTVERFCLWRYSYPFRFLMNFNHDGFINTKLQSNFEIAKRLFLWIIVFPISFIDLIIGKFFKLNYLHNKRFTDQTKQIITLKLSKFVNKQKGNETHVDVEDGDAFTLIYHYTVENTKNHQQKFINYVALYGFSRSISFILIITFWYSLFHISYFHHWSFPVTACVISISLLAYLFYLNFCKFYRRFSMEVILTFITLD